MRFLKRLRSARSAASASGALLVLSALCLPTGLAGQDPNDPNPYSNAWLVSEVSSFQPGTPFTVAVRFEMDPDWHNYWKNSGDTGYATSIEWTLPDGFVAGEIQWPVPERYEYYPLVDYVYSDQLALLIEITPPADLEEGTAFTLSAHVDWLLCREECIPDDAEVAVEVSVTSGSPVPDPVWVALFRETRDRLPKAVDGWSMEAEAVESGYRLTVFPSDATRPFPDSVYFFASEGSVVASAAAQPTVVENGRLTLELAGSPYASHPTSILQGVLKAEDGGGWGREGANPGLLVDIPVEGVPEIQESQLEGANEAKGPALVEGAQGFTLALALLFAFFGGILLNLMPCVFPVLSLKILGAVSQGGENRARIRNQGMMFGLGVVLAFMALGGLLIGLRAGGAQLGWGFQLQAPTFVAFMAALFFAIGLNLMGVFEIGAAFTRVGSRTDTPGGYGESLASGVLATIIATPCTAPFMGAALGFALTRSVPETLLIFGLLGIGMALPYVVLSTAPGLLERLPSPGPWMETMRQILAFPMFATVIWLTWVFGQQTGVGGASFLLSALLLVAAAGWMVGRWHRIDLRSGYVARAVSLGLLAAAVLLVVRASKQDAPLMAVEEGWSPFSQEEVERTMAQGRPVFVDFTAAWCLTCQVNERIVLSTESVQQAFRERDVALFKADWTRHDPAITSALEALNRTGVPVYALYGGNPGAAPYLLPSVLTEQIVLDALDEVLPAR